MAACAVSKGGAVLFTGTTDTYSPYVGTATPDEAPIAIRAISITGGSAAGAITLKEGSNATGLADASGGVVAQGYFAIGVTQYIFFDEPFIVNGGLKLSALTTAAIVVVYLA